jgi:hypothetical protein
MTTTQHLHLVGREVDQEAGRELRELYGVVVSSNRDSVRASWRFGQRLDSYSDDYTRAELAIAVGLSVSTVQKYLRLYRAYQRPELAQQAAEQLETFNIQLIIDLQDRRPVAHGRPLGGRRYRYRCAHCSGVEIHREEITDPAELAALALVEAVVTQ